MHNIEKDIKLHEKELMSFFVRLKKIKKNSPSQQRKTIKKRNFKKRKNPFCSINTEHHKL